MQWIIDVILSLVADRVGYFDRGDPSAIDFNESDLFADYNWHPLDLSAIIPEKVRLVRLCVVFAQPYVNRRIQFRTHGNSFVNNRSSLHMQVADTPRESDVLIAPDVDGKVDYRVTVGSDAVITITVGGWWL